VKNPDWQLRGTDLQADIGDASGREKRFTAESSPRR